MRTACEFVWFWVGLFIMAMLLASAISPAYIRLDGVVHSFQIGREATHD